MTRIRWIVRTNPELALTRTRELATLELATLTPNSRRSVIATERLLETILELKRQGVAQIVISHRLTDIFAVGDRVMVLKGGENVGDRYVEYRRARGAGDIIASGTRETALSADAAV